MSSKYDCVLDALIIMIGSSKFEYIQESTIMLIHYVKFDIRVNPILQNSSQESSMSPTYDCVFYAFLIMLGSWKLAYNSIRACDVYSWCRIWYQWWPKSLYLQSGTINVLQVWLCSCCTYNYNRELKLSCTSQGWQVIFIHAVNFGGLDHIWYQIRHHESSLFVIPELYSNFQLPSMVLRTTRT